MFPARHPRTLRRAAALGVLALTLAAAARAQEPSEPFSQASKQAFLDSLDPLERDYVIDVEARAFLPGLAEEVPLVAGHARVYVQFERALGAAERERLFDLGVVFDEAMTRHTYVARVDADGLEVLRRHPLLRGIEPIEPADKLTATLYSGDFPPHAARADGTVDVRVRFHEGVSLRHALRVLDRWDVPTPERETLWIGDILPATVTHGQALVLAEEQAVAQICEAPTAPIEDNVHAAALSNIDALDGGIYDLHGEDVDVGVWDGGNPDFNHPDIGSRVLIQEAGPLSGHATHVMTTIAGDGSGDASALGMAPDMRNLFSYLFDGDPANEQTVAKVNDGVDLTNHSWGRVVGWRGASDTGNEQLFGLYDLETRAWDAMVRGSGLCVQKSAGNDRNDCAPGTSPPSTTDCDGEAGADGEQYDTIATIGTAKNIITVGAVDHVTGVPIAPFSSSGPTNDGRIKPDVVADGVDLYSGWASSSPFPGCTGQSYCTLSGTSMSTAVTTGAVALLIEEYRKVFFGVEPSPACIKAILVNTARDLGRPGPDYLYGHGLVDALRAAETIRLGEVRIVEGDVQIGEVDEYAIEVGPGELELDVTLSWIDPPGAANSLLLDTVHDLDLLLVAPDGSVRYPYTHPSAFSFADPAEDAVADRPNPVDTVEHVHVDDPLQGVWRVRVKGTSAGAGQTYCATSTLPFHLDDQPSIEVIHTLLFPDACLGDAPQSQTLSIFNTGGAPLYVHDIQRSGGSNTDFVLGGPGFPFTVQPGGHVDVAVAFHPAGVGLRSSGFFIHSNDVARPQVFFSARAFVGEPSLRVSMEGRGRFGIVPTGHLETLNLQIMNEGDCDLEVLDLAEVVPNPLFRIGEVAGIPSTGPAIFPFTLFPGEQVDVPIVFGPSTSDYGLQTVFYDLITDDPTSPVVSMVVSARVPSPNIEVTGSLRFGDVCAGQLSEKDLVICNTGGSDLHVDSVEFDAPCPDFTIVGNPYPAVLPTGACLPVTVRYTPSGTGPHACTLRIESDSFIDPVVLVEATGVTPGAALYATPELEFEPTVIRSVDNGCENVQPLQIADNGACPVEIADVRLLQTGSDYELLNLPALPTTLLPGEVLGDGNLAARFAPQVVQRHIAATVEVDYVTNVPNVGDVATVQTRLCGEGVLTGARITVWLDGGPVPVVDRITLYRILYPDTTSETPSFVQSRNLVPLTSVLAQGPCDAFVFHEEWGGVSNPLQLGAGTYQVNVQHVVGGNVKNHSLRFVIDDPCDFFSRLTLDISQP